MYDMNTSFDLISDLHTDLWDEDFNWEHRATSPFCILAGDITQDRPTLIRNLKHLASCYQVIFYIDGNNEHVPYFGKLTSSYKHLTSRLETIPNLVFLRNNVVIMNGVAFLAANGWWTFDFDQSQNVEKVIEWYKEKWDNKITDKDINWIIKSAFSDALYLTSSVTQLQKHGDVQNIVIITHTVPDPSLIRHDIHLTNNPRFSVMGNSYLQSVLDADVEKKIHTWCFGHYHLGVDRVINGVRFVNNCRGRPNTQWNNLVYNPLRLIIN